MTGASTLISAELLRILRDPAARARPLGPEAHVADLLRGRVLERIAKALRSVGASAMLVKGAALALTHYPPGTRPMSDVDLLVRRRDRPRIIDALESEGFIRHFQPERPLTSGLLGEAQFTVECGSISSVIEVHLSLDKIAPRPRYENALWERAIAAPKMPLDSGLFVPSPEDHALLVAIHAASHEYNHEIAFLDFELLLRRGLDRGLLVSRAHEARCSVALYVMLAALRSLGAASVDDKLLADLDPGPLRRRAIESFYRVGGYPVARMPFRLGLPWVVCQTPLRDDLLAWTGGVALYAALRLADRAVAACIEPSLSNSGSHSSRARSRA